VFDGGLSGPFEFFGPFTTMEIVREWAKTNYHADVVMKLKPIGREELRRSAA
jgi:hypothetical protein